MRLTEDVPPAAGISSLNRLGNTLKKFAIKPFWLKPASREAIANPPICFKKFPTFQSSKVPPALRISLATLSANLRNITCLLFSTWALPRLANLSRGSVGADAEGTGCTNFIG